MATSVAHVPAAYQGMPRSILLIEHPGFIIILYNYLNTFGYVILFSFQCFSGMEFYTRNVFPKWKNNLFIGAMALTHLNRVVIKNNKVVHEERILKELNSCVRCIKQGPDGYLYPGIDGGKILRLKPE
jgi:hypothetical protein